jgi:hypothetical protein
MIVAGLVFGMLTVYAAGYFLGCNTIQDTSTILPLRVRGFRANWQCTIFSPAAWAEAKLTGYCIYLTYENGDPYGELHSSYPTFP